MHYYNWVLTDSFFKKRHTQYLRVKLNIDLKYIVQYMSKYGKII
jgi:hypothetical protein